MLIEDVILTTTLSNKEGERAEVRVCEPREREDGVWVCQYQVLGIDEPQIFEGTGTDGLATLRAIVERTIPARLDATGKEWFVTGGSWQMGVPRSLSDGSEEVQVRLRLGVDWAGQLLQDSDESQRTLADLATSLNNNVGLSLSDLGRRGPSLFGDPNARRPSIPLRKKGG